MIAGGFTRGRSSSSTPATLIEIYDPSTDLLAIGASMSTPRGFHTATLLPDGTVLASGGTGAVEIAKPAEVYDPRSDGWSPVGSMVFGTMLHRAVLLDDGRILTFGGSRDGQELSLPEVYEPSSRTWSVAYQLRFTKAPSPEE